MSAAWPALLERADFCRVRFALDFYSRCRLGSGELLRLRRPLLAAVRQSIDVAGDGREQRLVPLFEPVASSDPCARRRYQKPAPPFVIRPGLVAAQTVEEGDRLELEVLFFGAGTARIADFVSSLDLVGQNGLVQGEGHFEVTEAHSCGLHGELQPLWCQGQRLAHLTPEIHTLASYLDLAIPVSPVWQITIDTPARLIRNGQPLRAPRFIQLFPFMLRRVTSMLHAHCGFEVCADARLFMDAAMTISQKQADWKWLDGRESGRHAPVEPMAGLIGQLLVEGREGLDCLWVIALSALFGVGRGAAYGAGQLRLEDVGR
ncbi:MAG: hypothetical protein RQ723_01950 [Desulfuromonadales bacterium]|nr:hypothetical protein [Desulfuromonadales bacterium]